MTATHGPVEAVVFDFDGVIADSEPAHEAAILEAVSGLGLSFSHEQYAETIIGFDDRDAFAAIAAMHGRELSSDDLIRLADVKKRAFESAVAGGRVHRFGGAIELAQDLRGRVPIAVCSGALRAEIDLILAAFDAADVFSIIVTADDVERAKPDPAGYRMAAERLGVGVGGCLAIEDTPTGLEAARAAGYGRLVAVEHSFEAEHLAEADVTVSNIAMLAADALLIGG